MHHFIVAFFSLGSKFPQLEIPSQQSADFHLFSLKYLANDHLRNCYEWLFCVFEIEWLFVYRSFNFFLHSYIVLESYQLQAFTFFFVMGRFLLFLDAFFVRFRIEELKCSFFMPAFLHGNYWHGSYLFCSFSKWSDEHNFDGVSTSNLAVSHGECANWGMIYD